MSRRPVRPRPMQLELFRSRPSTPDWQRLPMDVRHKAVPLLARLLRAYCLARRAKEKSDE